MAERYLGSLTRPAREGKRAVERVHAWARDLAGIIPAVFLPDHRIETARLLVAGVDVWVNTPRPPLEASGTSGMKTALNGVPSLSVLDGWWVQGCEEGVTGWAVGAPGSDVGTHAEALYGGMLRRYACEAYLR